jgi:SAM-dependent methyltransferase
MEAPNAHPPKLTRLGERVLMALSRDPSAPDHPGGTVRTNIDNALDFCELTVRDFRGYIRGKVLDFGCGWGNQAIALARLGKTSEVVGVDIRNEYAKHLVAEHNCADRVRIVDKVDQAEMGTFDTVLSCSSMEHFSDPAVVVEEMKKAVKPGGHVIITFAEPWFGPRGSHFDAYSRLPWVNLIFSERTVMRVRAHFRSDGASRYEEVAGGLNRMSVAKFERIIRRSGMDVEFFRVYITKRMNFLARIPVARELFASAAACVLRKREG